MFIQSKEGRQYSFSVELSSKEINEQTLAETISFFDRTLHQEKNVREIEYSSNVDIPVSVFREGNNGLRAIVKFLKEEKKLTFSKIASLLDRDQRTIWSAYNCAKTNISKKTKNEKRKTINKKTKETSSLDEPTINSSIFANRNFSILESASMHLLNSYSVKETAQILGRNQMTIWTVKRRAELKSKESEIASAKKSKMKRGQRNE